MKAKLACMLSLMAVFASGTVLAANNMTMEFHTPETRSKTVLVLPVHATLTITRVGQNEPVIAESDAWEVTTQERLTNMLAERGYEVSVLQRDNEDPAIQELMKDVDAKFEESHGQIALKNRDIIERRFNLGGSARALAQMHDVDAIVIPRVNASAQAGGAAVMSALIGGGQPSVAAMNVTVVDAATGDVEAYFYGGAIGVTPDSLKAADTAVISNMVTRSLKKYPASDKAVKMNKKTQRRAVARSVPESDDGEVLSELEDLIGETD